MFSNQANPVATLIPSGSRSAWGGLVKRKETWTLTARGWFTLLGVACLLALVFVWRVYPFLAPTHRVDSEYLVVEGWIPDYALVESINEFKSKPYRRLFTVGCEMTSLVNIDPGDNHADYAMSRLKWLGMSPELMQPVVAHTKYRNRTYESALALRRWIEEKQLPITNFNVVTIGPHARRSQLLFEKAFQGQAKIGTIAVPDQEYDSGRWWKYSEGVKEILSEGASYLYVRLFFWPSHPGAQVPRL